jgi:pimeloyl-ACP methyl ester carboxylesterase
MNFTSNRKTLTIDNKILSYIDIGSGPALLFGHSYLWDAQMWLPQIELLSQHYRCILPDLWGHGESESLPDACHSLQDIAGHMLHLMDQLAIEEFSIVGLSVGGMWGAELALIVPNRVKTLVMLGCFVGFEPEVARAKYYTMLDIIKNTQTVPDSLIAQIAPLFFANGAETNTPELFNDFKQALRDIKPEKIDTICRLGKIIFGRRDTLEEIEGLTASCLIMTGVEDKVRPVLEGYLMHDAIRGSEFINIPQAGHISTLEQPEFVNNQLKLFLNKHHA